MDRDVQPPLSSAPGGATEQPQKFEDGDGSGRMEMSPPPPPLSAAVRKNAQNGGGGVQQQHHAPLLLPRRGGDDDDNNNGGNHAQHHHHHYHHHNHPPLSPASRRPLTTHTALGSPLPPNAGSTRLRSSSLGSVPFPFGAGGLAPTSPYYGGSARSVPVSPVAAVAGYNGGAQQHQMLAFPSTAMPMPSLPPEPSEVQKVMEAAATSERVRARKLEEEERDLSADELRQVLKRERHRTGRIAADLAASKAAAVRSQFEAEVIEEGRVNALLGRLDTVQREKGRIIVELEREEEMLTNTLQKKLDEVRREKAELERQIEREHKAHAVLQTQLSDLRNSHLSVAEALEEEDEMEEEG